MISMDRLRTGYIFSTHYSIEGIDFSFSANFLYRKKHELFDSRRRRAFLPYLHLAFAPKLPFPAHPVTEEKLEQGGEQSVFGDELKIQLVLVALELKGLQHRDPAVFFGLKTD